MSQPIDDGGAAYPQHGWSNSPETIARMQDKQGMSLRDWFAGQVDVSVYAPRESFEINHGRAPTVAELADYIATIRLMEAYAMLRARKGGRPMSQHTPTEWEAIHDSFQWHILDPETGWIIASDIVDAHTCRPSEANAHLIAAAPKMLEAAKQALQVFVDQGWDDDLSAAKSLKSAIAKAEGKA